MLDVDAIPVHLPKNFTFGFATAAYQVEGATNEGGRGETVWDELCRKPGAIQDGTDGSTGIGSYHLYPEDIKLLKQFGANAYRFSIAWSRIIPLGDRHSPVNETGVRYYSDLIDLLVENGITPYVTIYHWDLPSPLQHKYGGWTNRDELGKVGLPRYSQVLFERFGDRVKNWITINEPAIICHFSSSGLNPTWKPDDLWTTCNTIVWAHALAVDIYRRKFKAQQQGRIGITLSIDWAEPADGTEAAIVAAQRALDQYVGMFADPIYLGKYPESMLNDFREKIPNFTEDEWRLVKGSSDFFGMNHYTTHVYTGERSDQLMQANVVSHQLKPDGSPLRLQGECEWLKSVPWGFRKVLQYVHDKYAKLYNHEIIITEQGFCRVGENSMSKADVVSDEDRQRYYAGYLKQGLEGAVGAGIPVSGYFAWSLADNMEWMLGYVPRFGVTHIDRENNFERTPKDSALFLKRWFDVAMEREV